MDEARELVRRALTEDITAVPQHHTAMNAESRQIYDMETAAREAERMRVVFEQAQPRTPPAEAAPIAVQTTQPEIQIRHEDVVYHEDVQEAHAEELFLPEIAIDDETPDFDEETVTLVDLVTEAVDAVEPALFADELAAGMQLPGEAIDAPHDSEEVNTYAYSDGAGATPEPFEAGMPGLQGTTEITTFQDETTHLPEPVTSAEFVAIIENPEPGIAPSLQLRAQIEALPQAPETGVESAQKYEARVILAAVLEQLEHELSPEYMAAVSVDPEVAIQQQQRLERYVERLLILSYPYEQAPDPEVVRKIVESLRNEVLGQSGTHERKLFDEEWVSGALSASGHSLHQMGQLVVGLTKPLVGAAQ